MGQKCEVTAMTTSGLRRLARSPAYALVLAAALPFGVHAAAPERTTPAAAPQAAAPQTSTATATAKAPTAGFVATTDSQREAAAVLDRMARYLAGLQTFAFDVRAGYDVVQANGQKIEFGETRRFVVARPNRMRVEEVASHGGRNLAVFDGKTVTAFNADAGVYAQAPQPGPLDDALIYFVRDLQMRMPLALLLTTRLPTELPQRLTTIDYVEETVALGVPAHHIAGRTEGGVDFQMWVSAEERPVLLRAVLTYVRAEGQPQFWANFANWTTTPKLGDATFRFTPPADARQITFAVQMRPRGPKPGAPASSGEVAP